MHSNKSEGMAVMMMGLFVLMIISVIVTVWMWGMPKYRIYRQDLQGQANLRQQEWEKKIAVEGARAEKESAILKAEAEVERAKGVARANEIIADGLKGHSEYLRYLWITHLEQGEGREVIYVPTEAGLPILEAGKR